MGMLSAGAYYLQVSKDFSTVKIILGQERPIKAQIFPKIIQNHAQFQDQNLNH